MDTEEYYPSREERDPRRRKRPGDEMPAYDERPRSRSKERSSRRDRSRSRSRSGDRYHRRGHEDEWTKKSEAFIQKLSHGPPTDPRLARHQAQQQPGLGAGYPPPPGGPGTGYGGPPPGYPPVPPPGAGYPGHYPPAAAGYHQGYPPPDTRDSDRKKDWSTERKDEKKRRDDEEDSDDGEKKRKQEPLSADQREKLLKQREQYEVAAEKLEDQLLKLKEQREILKGQGHKHEDNIMKENAKLQKEVKYRISYMKEYMEKIDKGLEDDAKMAAEAKEKEKTWRAEQERIRVEMEKKNRDSSRDSSEEKDRKKKKKKKEKSRTRSSSSSSDEDKKKKKKKKKAKARSRSASSDSSDSDGDRNKKMEEELFSMVAELTSRKTKKSSRDSGEEVLIDLMKKMSESYSKIKKENSETSARCVILENQNKVLKRQVEDLQEKLEVMNSDGRESRKSDKEREGPASKKSRFASESSEKDEQKYRYSQAPPAPVPVPVPAPVPPVMAPSGWGHEAEREQRYKEPDRHEERDRYRDDRPERYRDERTERYRDPREDRYRDDRRERGDRGDRRDRYREDRRRSERSSSRSRERHRSGERSSKSGGRDKNEKIDLKDWTKPPDQPGVDPTLLSLKEKMKAKEEEAAREDELRSRWITKEMEPTPPPELPKPIEQPLPENRSSIKMSWGMGTRKTPDPGPPAKKNTSLVGKMPWVKNGSAEPASSAPPTTSNGSSGTSAPRRSRFGPQVSVGSTIPPPSMVSQAPTLAVASEPVEAGHNPNFPPPPPPMVAPPPGAQTQGPPAMQQSGGWGQVGHPGPEGMAAPPPNNGGYGGYGYGYGMAPPEMAQPQEPVPPKVVRNPRPQPMDMHAMIAAAQNHMQKNLTAKMASIGVPMSAFGMATGDATVPDSIPLPEDPMGMDIGIADVEIPLPIGGADDDRPPGDDDCAPPGCD